MKDLYKVLGVEADADFPQIRDAYRNLSKKYHPDLNGGDTVYEEKFKNILEAYTILKDPYKRKVFDKKLRQRKESSRLAVNHRPSEPALSSHVKHAAYASHARQKKKRSKQEIRKDLYMGGGILLFLVLAITILVSLERSFYLEESYLENIEHTEKTLPTDSMNLIHGFTPDSVYTSGAGIKTGGKKN